MTVSGRAAVAEALHRAVRQWLKPLFLVAECCNPATQDTVRELGFPDGDVIQERFASVLFVTRHCSLLNDGCACYHPDLLA